LSDPLADSPWLPVPPPPLRPFYILLGCLINLLIAGVALFVLPVGFGWLASFILPRNLGVIWQEYIADPGIDVMRWTLRQVGGNPFLAFGLVALTFRATWYALFVLPNRLVVRNFQDLASFDPLDPTRGRAAGTLRRLFEHDSEKKSLALIRLDAEAEQAGTTAHRHPNLMLGCLLSFAVYLLSTPVSVCYSLAVFDVLIRLYASARITALGVAVEDPINSNFLGIDLGAPSTIFLVVWAALALVRLFLRLVTNSGLTVPRWFDPRSGAIFAVGAVFCLYLLPGALLLFLIVNELIYITIRAAELMFKARVLSWLALVLSPRMSALMREGRPS
jgi:hypothetical protein